MNYEKDIRIDETALDVEWWEQPSLFMKYAKNAANCQLEFDRCKEKLDLVRAELDKEIRENPEKFGINKITENAISNQIIFLKKYRDTNNELLKAKYELEIARVAVQAMNQRKEALENLVRLHGQSYFAGPKVPRDFTREAQNRHKQEETNKRIGSSISRGR